MLGGIFIALLRCSFGSFAGANESANRTQSIPPMPSKNMTQLKLSPVITKVSRFDHNRSEHKQDCSFCHVRVTNDVIPKFPYHTACIDCHVPDFTSTVSQMCAVCHEMPLAAKVKTVRFTPNLSEFGLKSFSHRDHMDPGKMKTKEPPKCLSCHRFDAGELRANFPSHPECYSCHTHQARQKLGTCETCHSFSVVALKYTKGLGTPFTSYRFTHGSHLKDRTIQYKCEKCHTIVTSPIQANVTDIGKIITIRENNGHTSACWQCHNKRTELKCNKCHVTSPI
jgi:Cytochrome c7 and related cytochrome c